MVIFTGNAEHSIDSKGRVPVPSRMRRVVERDGEKTHFMATRGVEQCVCLYPIEHWQNEVVPQLAALNQYQPESRQAARRITMFAEPVTLDAQGRAAFSRGLAEWAGLQPGGKALVTGVVDRIEIWDPSVFKTYLNQTEGNAEETTDRALGGRPSRLAASRRERMLRGRDAASDR